MGARLYNEIYVYFSPVVNYLCVELMVMNVDTNCQVLVFYKSYTLITAIFQVI